MVIMRLVLELCAAPRRLVFRRAVFATVSSLSAVIAGLVTASDCMFFGYNRYDGQYYSTIPSYQSLHVRG